MVELASRIPIQLTPRQTVLAVAVAAGVVVAVMAGLLFESVVGGVVRVVLRLTGHQPPRKSSFSVVLDDLEERLRDK